MGTSQPAQKGQVEPISKQPEPIVISDDAAKLLVAQHGVRGAARVLGMDKRATDAFRKRVQRAGWCQDPVIGPLAAVVAKENQRSPIVASLSPTQAHNEEMKRLSGQTRLSVARTVARGFEHAETLPGPLILASAQDLKALGNLGDTAHRWSDSAPVVKVSLSLTGEHRVQAEQTSENEPEVVEAEWVDVPA